jgi:hypothetical protein
VGTHSLSLLLELSILFGKGGTGPKLNELLQMREKHLLQDRIELLGAVRHSDVRDVSVCISIYLLSGTDGLELLLMSPWKHRSLFVVPYS